MAKKSTSRSTTRNVYDKVTERINAPGKVCFGSTRTSEEKEFPANHRPLSMDMSGTGIAEECHYDSRKGSFVQRPVDIVDHAKRNIGNLKINTVTGGRFSKRPGKDDGANEQAECAPCITPGIATTNTRKRGYLW